MEELGNREIKHAVDNILNNLNPDVVIAGAIAFPSGALSTAWVKRYGKKIIIFDDAKIADVPRGKMTTFIKQRIYKCVDAMLYPSEDWMETGLYWQFEREQLFYGVDVVDNKFWKVDDVYREKENYFVSVGRVISKKNFKFLIEAFSQWPNNSKYRLLIVGDGPEKDALKQICLEKSLSNVQFLPFLSQEELRSVYKKAQGFILASSHDETWGLVINEAMACGLPVIVSSRCGATKTLVQNGVNGFVFDPYCRESLVNALALFSRLTKEEQEEMGKQSSRLIQKWGLDRFVSGCFDAICYVDKVQSRKISILERIILSLWKGRYRPI